MPLEMRKTSQWWYGRYNLGGKVHCVNLRIKIEGTRPASIRQDGNAAFERSRGKAQEKFDAVLAEAKEKHQAGEYVQKLHVIRTGRRIGSVPVADLAKEWDAAPRRRRGSPRYVKQAHKLFEAFVAFVQTNYPDTETLADVTPEIAEAFMRAERDRKISGRTWNSKLVLLRSAFKAVAKKANIAQNPFDGIVTVEENTAHRMPFNQDELQAILKATEKRPFMQPLIVTGMCTAMRLGDCCRLRWEDVDLETRFVRVKTSKTGETVEIPMFALLADAIREHGVEDSDYLFPEHAAMYAHSPQALSYRVRKVFELAGFYDVVEEESEDERKKKEAEEALEVVPQEELLVRGLATLDGLPAGAIVAEKRERMREAFKLYVGGMRGPAVARQMGMGKATVSSYLREMETRTGLKIIRQNGQKRPKKCRGEVHAGRKRGLRRASVRDFHSFRVTWITLALAAGVPLELVQRVTGHKTTEVVLKHYFRPGRDAFKKALENAMPALLTRGGDVRTIDVETRETVRYGEAEGPSASLEKALEALKGVTGKANQARVATAVEWIESAKRWCDGRILREPQGAQA